LKLCRGKRIKSVIFSIYFFIVVLSAAAGPCILRASGSSGLDLSICCRRRARASLIFPPQCLRDAGWGVEWTKGGVFSCVSPSREALVISSLSEWAYRFGGRFALLEGGTSLLFYLVYLRELGRTFRPAVLYMRSCVWVRINSVRSRKPPGR